MYVFTNKRVPKVGAFLMIGLISVLGMGAVTVNDADTSISTSQVTLSQTQVPLQEVLQHISEQAGWGLVINLSDDLAQQKVTVLLPRPVSALDAVELVVSNTQFDVRLEGDILYVGDKAKSDSGDDLHSVGAPVSPVVSQNEPDMESRGSRNRHSRFKGRSNRKGTLGERVSFGDPVEIMEGESANKAVSIGASTRVRGEVTTDAVAVGGSLVVESGARVGNDAISIGGNVTVEPGGVVEGEAVAVGGKVLIKDGARVEGGRKSIPIKLPGKGFFTGLAGMGVLFWIGLAIFRSLVLLGIGLLVVWLLPAQVKGTSQYLAAHSIKSFFIGLLLLLGIVPLIVFLTLTIVGIPLVPLVAIAFALLVVFGLVVIMYWLGRVIPLFKNVTRPVYILFWGFVSFLVLNVIPVVGGIFLVLAALTALGAVFLSRFGTKCD